MARISQYLLDEEKLNKLFNLFFEIVGKRDDQEEFNKVIVDLLSPVERVMIAKRVAIVYLLLKKIDHRNICSVLKVSSSTVAKFSLLMEKSLGIVPIFKSLLRNEQFIGFLSDIFDSFFAPGVPSVNWKAAWERKFEKEKLKTYGI